MVVEVVGVLAQYMPKKDLELAIASLPPIKLMPEEAFYDEAIRVARNTGSRTVHVYYITIILLWHP